MRPANTFVGFAERAAVVYGLLGGLFVVVVPWLIGLGVI